MVTHCHALAEGGPRSPLFRWAAGWRGRGSAAAQHGAHGGHRGAHQAALHPLRLRLRPDAAAHAAPGDVRGGGLARALGRPLCSNSRAAHKPSGHILLHFSISKLCQFAPWDDVFLDFLEFGMKSGLHIRFGESKLEASQSPTFGAFPRCVGHFRVVG